MTQSLPWSINDKNYMLKEITKKILDRAGYEIRSKRSLPQTNYGLDEKVYGLYREAQKKCGMEDTDNEFRRQRHYTLNYLLWR